jgi:hypothetical protein
MYSSISQSSLDDPEEVCQCGPKVPRKKDGTKKQRVT